MKEQVRQYVDNLFSEIHDTKQLRELKEEVSANLLEKINDFVSSGYNEEKAFNKGVSSLGDMNELVESLKKASETKAADIFREQPLDRKHVLGYLTASAILLFGIMTTGIVYLQQNNNLLTATATLMPFLIASVVIFVYFGLTQETSNDYGMNWKRALAYSLASGVMLFGIFVTGIVYFSGNQLFEVVASSMPFIIPSLVMFIYLGLTEKSRTKMDNEWQKQWIMYYSNPHEMMLRGNISGALWIFTFAVFILLGFTWGWRYSWIVFIFAAGFEVLIEAYFAARKKSVKP